ncbi:hypothetical protein DH2020_029398 [Rehmannia glutinosa]|uniref:Uncharacterized protein n=1 Tax=Rehmannia glutinosa TaxID=99300 RepID=A0ABR0VNP4_REHGL
MIQTVPLNCSMSSFLVEPNRFTQCSKSTASRSVSCSVSRSNIPKLEPFSRNKIDRAVKEPPLIQKSENQIAGKYYCLTLEGDDSYSCWQAYFELKDLERFTESNERVENTGSKPCPIPDGLPKTAEELEEEEKARMPDSPFTRLLRARGRYPAWYSPAPEHETD